MLTPADVSTCRRGAATTDVALTADTSHRPGVPTRHHMNDADDRAHEPSPQPPRPAAEPTLFILPADPGTLTGPHHRGRRHALAAGGVTVGFALDAGRNGFYTAEAAGRLMLLTYETLTTDPARALAAVYAFLGLAPPPTTSRT